VTAEPARPWKEGARAVRGAGGRLHLSEGPIFLVLDLTGPPAVIVDAEQAARIAFDGLLARLAAELPQLRKPAGDAPRLRDPVARAMGRAVQPFAEAFITPMAAVAGAVADHMLAALCHTGGLTRAVVNNGGDIALFLGAGQRYRLGIHDGCRGLAGQVDLNAGDHICGVATSGWRGRSHSLGIADAVTVLAGSAAAADAAATMIANAVDLPGSDRIVRQPACHLAPDSDLGNRLVTTGVAPLSPAERADALARGLAYAEQCRVRGLIRAAFLCLQGEVRVTGGQAPLLHDREETP